MEFGEKLKYLRKQNGISQEELANKLNVSRQAISKWETGTLPDIENVKKISLFFDCSLEYLINDEVEDKNEEKKNGDTNIKRSISPECILYISMWGILLLQLIIYVVSQLSTPEITRQDSITGDWFVGYYAFIDKYNLYIVIYALVIIFILLVLIYGILKYRKYSLHGVTRLLKIMQSCGVLLKCVVAVVFSLVILRKQIITLSITLIILLLVYLGLLVIVDFEIMRLERREGVVNR